MTISPGATRFSVIATSILFAVGITAIVVTVAAALVHATEVFFILFLGVLFGILLTKLSGGLAHRTGLAYLWSLAIVIVSFLTLSASALTLFGTQINQQVSQLAQQLETSQRQLRKLIEDRPALGAIIHSTPFVNDLLEDRSASDAESQEIINQEATSEQNTSTESQSDESSQTASSPGSFQQMLQIPGMKAGTQGAVQVVMRLFRTTFGLVINVVVIFFVGVFLALDPERYRDGFVLLIPREQSERTREILNQVSETLWHWLIGRFFTMLITGVGAGLLLYFLNVPLAFTLGIITGLLTFVPNIGAIISLLLSLLMALPQGYDTVGMVFAGYIVLQLIESYVATPLIQQKQTSLPPALLIAFQAVMGILFGFLGAAVASPALAAGKKAIEEAYVRDVLKKGEQLQE